MSSNFIFFFGPESEFSHWHKCRFIINEKIFCCAGQYIMFKKALLFNDEVIAGKILTSSDPKRHRQLGKELQAFDKEAWHQHCMQFSFEANLAKFSQNENLKTLLLESGDRIFAEASPYDCIWGIGLSLSNPKIHDPQNWRGKNLAGESLMQVRVALKK